MLTPTTDRLMYLQPLRATEQPQRLVWQAMHQCYSCEPAYLEQAPDETEAGLSVVKHLLANNRGHYSPLEQVHLSVSCSYLPHSLLQQFTRQRIFSFSVQSFRYTSEALVAYANKQTTDYLDVVELEKLVYVRGEGSWFNRTGARYTQTPQRRLRKFQLAHAAILEYALDLSAGVSEEDARGSLPFDLRQHAVVGANLRAWWHLLDLRLKPDAQPEFQQFSQQVQQVLGQWVPQLQEWYDGKRASRAVLSP